MVEEGRACIILNQISPLALTLFGQDNVLGLPLDNGDNQKWIPTSEGENRLTLRNVANGKFLSTAGRPEPGVDLIVADSPTVWQLRPGQQGPDIVLIVIQNSSLGVSFPGDGHVPPGAPVLLQEDTRQAWKLLAA